MGTRYITWVLYKLYVGGIKLSTGLKHKKERSLRGKTPKGKVLVVSRAVSRTSKSNSVGHEYIIYL